MAIVDDLRLEELAAPRLKDLFPILERIGSLSPLVVLLTILPGIVALEFAATNETDAQWRLKTLELSNASSLFDAVDPSRATDQPVLKWQPPLGTWIPALFRHLPWPLGEYSLELSAYLFAASLVPATFFVASRALGRRVGFISALLVAFHSTFLQQHQHAAPYGLAVAAALGTLGGFLGHIWNTSELVSIDLLIGGICLGVCLLAGGPLAFVVVAVLMLVVVGTSETPAAASPGAGYRGRRGPSRWDAARSLGILAATAFAAGGWWELMMLYSYQGEFLSGWLWGAPNSIAIDSTVAISRGEMTIRSIGEFFSMARVLAGPAVLGCWVVGRSLVAPRDSDSKRSYRFLAAWTGCAVLVLTVAARQPAPASPYLAMWRAFAMLALTICAAVGFDEAARRRIGLLTFVGVTFAFLLLGALFLGPSTSEGTPSIGMMAGALAAAGLAAVLFERIAAGSDLRKRLVLTSLIASLVIADASIGLAAVRTKDADAQALRSFRRGLPSGIDVEACVIISDGAPLDRLKFALKSTWPNAQVFVVKDWDESLRIARGDGPAGGGPRTAIVVDWSQGNSRPANPTGAQWTAEPIGNPQFFEERQLRAYVLVWERPGPPSEN